MTRDVTRRSVLGACALVSSVATVGCVGDLSARQRTEFERTLDMATGRITIETDSGDATVSRTDDGQVRLHGTKETESPLTNLEDMTVETTRNGDHLRVSADSGGDSFLGLGGGSMTLDVGVPDDVRVERVSTKNGTATATGVAGDATLESTNGAVAAHDVEGDVSLASTNGGVRAQDVAGLDGAETTNGDVQVDIPAIDGDVSVFSTNGTVIAALAPDLDATVVASASNGNLSVDGLPLAAENGPDNSLRGTLGNGKHELTIETTNGSVLLHRLPRPG